MNDLYKNWKARMGILLLFVLLLSLGLTDNTVLANQVPLEQKLEQILSDERLAGSQIGISVRDAMSGDEIYHYNGHTRLHPASNMKILTAITALETLGPDYQFTTEVLTDGNIDGPILNGNLYLKGKGDPSLVVEDLIAFSQNLKELGIKEIHGHLIGDDQWYDSVRLSQDLNWSDEFNFTGAQISALTLSPDKDYDTGTVKLEILPTSGESAQINIFPETDYVTIKNETKMVSSGEKRNISIEREHGTNQIIVGGTVPEDSSAYNKWVAVWEPTELVLDVFKRVLEKEGIRFHHSSKVKTAATPKDTALLVEKKSMPLKELMIPFMKLSNNGFAEMFVKEVGKVIHQDGSWESGLKVMDDTIQALGVPSNAILIRDGSGMSHKNLISARELTKLLYTIQEKGWHHYFVNSLPIGGMSERYVGGTLRNRFHADATRGKVFAKTGSLTGVSTLSGYLKTENGTQVIFSILNNNFLGAESDIMQLQDTIITTLAKHHYES